MPSGSEQQLRAGEKEFVLSPSVKEPTFYAEAQSIASWQKAEENQVGGTPVPVFSALQPYKNLDIACDSSLEFRRFLPPPLSIRNPALGLDSFEQTIASWI